MKSSKRGSKIKLTYQSIGVQSLSTQFTIKFPKCRQVGRKVMQIGLYFAKTRKGIGIPVAGYATEDALAWAVEDARARFRLPTYEVV